MRPDDTQTVVRTLARLARVLERSCPGLTLPQYRVLARVAEGDERASLLASRLAVAPPTITAVVDGLVEAGHLVREGDAHDRRATRIRLTAPGRRALRQAEQAMADRLGPVLAAVPEPTRLVEDCRAMEAHLDDARAARVARRSPAGAAR